MNHKALLQDLQDTYAEQLQLTVMITDASGKAVTAFSHLSTIAEYTIATIKCRYEKEQLTQSEWMKNLQNPILLDSQNLSPYIGMKIIVAPIQIGDENQYYLWAGSFIEVGYKTIVLQSLQQNKAINIEKVTDDLIELSIDQIGEKLQMVKNMAMVVTELMTSHHMKEELAAISEVSKRSHEDLSSINRYCLYLKTMLDLDKNIDTIVFAKNNGNHQYKVISAEGKYKNLPSKILSLGQTFAQECIEKKRYGIWRNIDRLEGPLIQDFPISLKSIFCFPLIVEQQVMGIILGGSETKGASFLNLIQYGNVLISNMAAYLEIDLIKESLDRHFMKMSTLLDLNRLLEMAANIDKQLEVIADFALMFIPSDFCVITLKNGKSTQKVKKGSIQLTELIELQHEECFRLSGRKIQPKLVETKWGTILEYPIYYSDELLGVMTLHLQDSSAIMETEVYMANLVNNSASAIKHLDTYRDKKNLKKSVALELLTSREQDVLDLLIQGKNNNEIAKELYISAHTVKNHITKIFQKLHVSDRSQLLAMVYNYQL